MIDWHRQLRIGLLAGGIMFIASQACAEWASYKSIFENLVPNADFEQFLPASMEMPDGWVGETHDKSSQASVEYQGFQSSHSVSLKGSGKWHTSIKGLTPNAYYILSFWVKREGWKDREYPSVKIFNKHIYQNELFAYGGWVPVSYIINSKHYQQTLLEFGSKNISDKIFYDNVSLKKIEINTLSPKNGETLQGGSAAFKWDFPKDSRVYRLKIHLADNGDFENQVIYKVDSPLGKNFSIPHPLKDGKWYWKISMWHGGLELSRSEVKTFGIVDSPYKGKPEATTQYFPRQQERVPERFFPIGIYGSPIEAFGELRQAGFNLVQSSHANFDYIKKFINVADLHGLKALTSIFRARRGDGLPSLLNSLKYNSGLYGWYIADEPEGRSLSPYHLWKLSKRIHASDPFHPTALVNVRSNKVVDYAPAADIVMVDPYPVPHRPLTWLSDSIDEARNSVGENKPVWAVVQAFNWAEGNPEYVDGRFPTYAEGRCLTYLSIVHGVNGLMYFSYKGARKNDPGQKHWKGIKQITGDLQKIYPLLLVPNLNEKINLEVIYNDAGNGGKKNHTAQDANGNAAIHYAIKKIESYDVSSENSFISPGKYLIAVNVIGETVEAAFTIKNKSSANVIFENRKVSISHKQMKDIFTPYSVHIYRLQ